MARRIQPTETCSYMRACACSNPTDEGPKYTQRDGVFVGEAVNQKQSSHCNEGTPGSDSISQDRRIRPWLFKDRGVGAREGIYSLGGGNASCAEAGYSPFV